MIRFFVALTVTILLLVSQSAFAITYDVFDPNDATGSANISSWINNLGGDITVHEDFEDIGVTDGANWYDSLSTGIGTFTAISGLGTGETSNPDGDLKFAVLDDYNYGRFNTTDSGTNYLDSADVKVITLILNDSLNLSNLFFYITDASDCNATTTTGANADISPYPVSNLSNGNERFVGISLGAGEGFIESITWTVSTSSDGYGLDDFSSVAPVPEPSTILLLGSGLIGLGWYGRKRRNV